MPVPYAKPYVDIAGQIALLQSRGMVITDTALAAAYLERIGYYRLSGYWYPFRRSTPGVNALGKPALTVFDDFQPKTEFRHAVELYVFDKRLRLLVLDAIERIEICIRVEIALRLGAQNPLAHRDPNCLDKRFTTPAPSHTESKHDKWLSRLDDIEDRSKEEFVKHFRIKYSSDLPLWMTIELWDFGMLSNFYAGMKNADQFAISQKYGVTNPVVFASWLRSINYIRNVSAHHSRLWNLSVVDQPQLPIKDMPAVLNHIYATTNAKFRVYAVLAIMKSMLNRINPMSSWGARLAELVDQFPAVPLLSISNAGFPANWKTEALWK